MEVKQIKEQTVSKPLNNEVINHGNNNKSAEQPGKTLGIVGFIFAFIGLGAIGVILSAISYHKSKVAGFKNGLALAGIWLNSISIVVVLSLFILVSTALPALQRSQRDVARKNYAVVFLSAVTMYSSNNMGALPQDSDITNGTFATDYLSDLGDTEYSIGISSEQPSESKMIFTRGVNCPDSGSLTGDRQYNIQVKLESGIIYCTGS